MPRFFVLRNFILKVLFFVVFFSFLSPLSAVELNPYPENIYSRDALSFSVFREERPSFYWVNTGVPDSFFSGVNQTSAGLNGSNVAYLVQSIVYGLQVGTWPFPWLQLKAVLPFESVAFTDAAGKNQDAQKIGDLEVASTLLLAGEGEKGNFAGLTGRVRFPTGSNPFILDYPLLGTGRGNFSGAVGFLLREEAGGFSFFEGLDYEQTQVVSFTDSPVFGSGSFQWPEAVNAFARLEWRAFERARRKVGLFCEFRMRSMGAMTLNATGVPYSTGRSSTDLFFSTLGVLVRVDGELSVAGEGTYFPIGFSATPPDSGVLFSLSVGYKIL